MQMLYSLAEKNQLFLFPENFSHAFVTVALFILSFQCDTPADVMTVQTGKPAIFGGSSWELSFQAN